MNIPIVNSVYHSLDGLGGFLRCERCGTQSALGEPSERLMRGWPTHCGYTMRWWTQRQIDAGEAPTRLASHTSVV